MIKYYDNDGALIKFEGTDAEYSKFRVDNDQITDEMEIDETEYWQLMIKPKKELLNSACKDYQVNTCGVSDIEVAIVNTSAANASNVKNIACKNWGLSLWNLYYTRKDALEADPSMELNLDFSSAGLPPHTFRECQQEAASNA